MTNSAGYDDVWNPQRCPVTAEDDYSRVRCVRVDRHEGAHRAEDGWEWWTA